MIAGILVGLAVGALAPDSANAPQPTNPAPRVSVLAQGLAGPDGTRYTGVSDTFLLQSEPDANFGRDGSLSVGPRRVLLIKFGDLSTFLPPSQRIDTASLEFTRRTGDPEALVQVGLVRRPWGEGQGGRLQLPSGVAPRPWEAITTGATWRRPLGPEAAAWEKPGAAGLLDQTPIEGATLTVYGAIVRVSGLASAFAALRLDPDASLALAFAGEAELASSESASEGPRLIVQTSETAPSSDPAQPAVQVVDLQPSGGERWTVTVRNLGTTASAPARLVLSENGLTVGEAPVPTLAPGASTTVSAGGVSTERRLDPRSRLVSARVVPGTSGPTSGPGSIPLTVPTDARSVRIELPLAQRTTLEAAATQAGFPSLTVWVHRAIQHGNDHLLAKSRSSFAPEGTKTRFRFAGWAEPGEAGAVRLPEAIGLDRLAWFDAILLAALGTAPEVLRDRPNGSLPALEGAPVEGAVTGWPGRLGLGDTRDDRLWPRLLPLPAVPGATVEGFDLPLEPNAPYGNLVVALLDLGWLPAAAPDWPSVVLVRLQQPTGAAVEPGTGQLYRLDGTTWSLVGPLRIGAGGTVNLPRAANWPTPMGPSQPGILALRVGKGNDVRVGLLTPGDVQVAFNRSGRGAAIVPVRVAGPSVAVDRSRDFALNRPVTSVSGTTNADLDRLTDGLPTTVTLAPEAPGSVEIDLGRDRPVAEVVLTFAGPVPDAGVRIETGITGDVATQRRPWATVDDLGWAFRRFGMQEGTSSVRVPIYGPLSRVRYLRITPIGTKVPVELAGVSIFGPGAEEEGTRTP